MAEPRAERGGWRSWVRLPAVVTGFYTGGTGGAVGGMEVGGAVGMIIGGPVGAAVLGTVGAAVGMVTGARAGVYVADRLTGTLF